jgi:signal transduction histidine kinase
VSDPRAIEEAVPEPGRRVSIAQSTLARIGVGIGLAILVATSLTYVYVVSSFESRTMEHLAKYVHERGHRERGIFAQAESHHAILEEALRDRLTELGDRDPRAEFERLFERHPDGVVRNRSPLHDGTRRAGVCIDEELPIDADVRRRVLAFYEVCNRYGPAWHDRFQNTYITTPENVMVIYWPEVPNWCQDAGPDLYMPDEEYVWVADRSHNPERETVWTGVFYDGVADVWMVSCETPVYLGDRHIATLGHDITLNELLDRTLGETLDGAHNVIFRRDGRLIAHPALMEEIQLQEGYFDIEESGSEELKQLYETVVAMGSSTAVMTHPTTGDLLAATTLGEVDWLFVTVYPSALLERLALRTAGVVLGLGLMSLLVALLTASRVIRRQVAEPLEKLTRATEHFAAGELRHKLPVGRDDELGRLARAFNRMTRTIGDRDARLSAHARELEDRVVARTDELERARLRAEGASHAKSAFLANVSHELRTPLNAIIGYSEILLEDAQESGQAEAAADLEKIQVAAGHVLSLVNDVLDLTKVEAGKVDLQLETFEVRPLLEDVVATVRPLAEKNRNALFLEVDPELDHMHSDATKVRQALFNLLANAAKFTGDGEIKLLARLEKGGDTFVRFEVEDTGSGIDAGELDRIFEEFTQGDGARNRDAGGAGLGLAITRRFCRMLGGDIGADSEPGRGSRFTIRIPRNSELPTLGAPGAG